MEHLLFRLIKDRHPTDFLQISPLVGWVFH